MTRDRVKELDDVETMAEDVVQISAKENAEEIMHKASEAVRRGAEVAHDFMKGAKTRYTDFVQKIEDNVKLNDFDKRVLEEVEINGLINDIRREYYETAKSAKRVQNAIKDKQILLNEYTALSALTSGVENVKIQGRKKYLVREIKVLSEILVELESTKLALAEAYKSTSEKQLYAKFMRIPSHIASLLQRADDLQSEGLNATSDIEEDEEVENG
jgi:hypothetical protein